MNPKEKNCLHLGRIKQKIIYLGILIKWLILEEKSLRKESFKCCFILW